MHEALQLLSITGVLFLSVLSPGPNFALVTSTAMSVSGRAGVLVGLGLAAASFTWALLTVAGLGVLLAQAPWVTTIIKAAGAVYLIWLGVKMVLEARRRMPARNQNFQSSAASVRKAYLVSMTNPKSIAFYGSIFTVMVPVSAPAWFYVAIVVVATAVSASWYCSLALLFSSGIAQRLFAKAKTSIETVMGVVLIGLGGKLLFSR